MENVTVDAFTTLLSSRLGVTYTDEQREMIRNFNNSFIAFASPGTGKTATAVGGLLTAELYYQIKGESIYALSFTRLATGELEVRHRKSCKKLGMKQTINFQTLHKLCTGILSENYRLLDMDSFKTENAMSIESLDKLVRGFCDNNDIKLNPYKVRTVISCIRSLNASLIFDREHVESKMNFKNCNLSYEDFTRIRQMLYGYYKLIEKIPVSDIMIYTLELLTRFPEISEAFKAKCKIMLVDEAQDLSLLQLRIISLLAQKAILIGDNKQRIYTFNGACQEVKEQYLKFYPEAEKLYLSRSFRCKNNIADFATSKILANNDGGEEFTGVAEGGVVTVDNNLDVNAIVENINSDFLLNNHTFPTDLLFLFRNNYSCIPLLEALYQKRVPCRSSKYPAAHTIPVIKELCEIMELALNHTTLANTKALEYLIPEFRGYRNYMDIPLVKIANEQGCSIFKINYKFRDHHTGSSAMQLLLDLNDMIERGKSMSELINHIWIHFNNTYLSEREHLMENPAKYFTSLVSTLVKDKTYRQFVNDEVAKIEFMDNCEKERLGVRCYTMHAAKGLEAHTVHIIDADEGTIPNIKKLEEMEKKECFLDAAKEVRNERSLVYVACTRAKEELHIHYSPMGELSSMFTDKNMYSKYDAMYAAYSVMYEDVDAFRKFLEDIDGE